MEFTSQVGQDKWVCEKLKYKRGGYFVDVGAADGIWLSNTLYLEKELGWEGICVEVNKVEYDKLIQNRNCLCINKAAHKEDGTVEFALSNEILGVRDNLQFPVSGDGGTMKTVTLGTLLYENGAPHVIDYISLDTEGNDYDVLLGFPFGLYDAKLWTIEHNAYADGGVLRDKIRMLMESHGYVMVPETAQPDDINIFESWFINPKYVQ